jgi:hypothetical protein
MAPGRGSGARSLPEGPRTRNAVAWLQQSEEPFEGSVFTAVPDWKDVPQFNSMADELVALYVEWFDVIAEAVFRRLGEGECAIFSQTDGRLMELDGTVLQLINKSHLLQVAAAKHGCTLLWHKIALNTATEVLEVAQHRIGYTHLLCFGKRLTYHTAQFRTPDVIDRGLMTWMKATGLHSCIVGVSFLQSVVHTKCIVSPFCGHGTILAVANYLGLPAVGVELLPKRARYARNKSLVDVIDAMSPAQLHSLGVQLHMLPPSHPCHGGGEVEASDPAVLVKADDNKGSGSDSSGEDDGVS